MLAKATIALVAVLCSLAPAARGAVQYSVTDLGDLSGGTGNSYAKAINERGQVVGVSNDHAFFWDQAAGMRDLGVLPGTTASAANALNNAGQVVGSSGSGSTRQAFIWDVNKGMQQLPQAGLSAPVATGINASGKVVGYETALPFRGLGWDAAGNVRTFDNPSVSGSPVRNILYALNDNGDAVGYSVAGNYYAALWDWDGPSDPIQLPTHTGPDYALRVPYAINQFGDVVGIYAAIVGQPNTAPPHPAAWIMDPDGYQFIHDFKPIPGSTASAVAKDINDLRQIVGYSGIPSSKPTGPAILWESDVSMAYWPHDLNTLLDSSGAGWQLRSAESINNRGQIVGYGLNPAGLEHAFLLTPVPEPSAALASTAALTLLLARRRR